ncbi:type III polyketide synthase [Cystobacter ferrugineus]|uniref:Naringenin-chalcone synthase n=2 Tax=Cystobacter TaxID=42 RepID=A0A1L9BJA2_9BACT|nr:type III polyketide synthase [Cystobacter ferrugineus]AYM53351.1 chalcone and stilbene synthase domain protein [Cystobacter ferrugineus]AYM53386.1 chalcone and stilbene synthase domain protein [Cystobacter velatus]OJH42323.1 naringenin-chalcone synthase [Cystobacter ferrugineus]
MTPVAPERRPTLLSIASAVPPLSLTQEEIYEGLFKDWFKNVPNAQRIIQNTGVRRRFFAWDPRVELKKGRMGVGDRVRVYERVGLQVTGESVQKALGELERSRVGAFTMTTNSGYSGPGLDLYIAKKLGLPSSIRRTFVGHMGCFAAFPVLRTAMDSVAARPDEYVIANASEYSSLHYHDTPDPEQVVIHGLFGDAACTVVMGSAPDGEGVQFLRSHTEQLYDTHELMGWNMHNDGFRMNLSPYVPFVLAEHVDDFLEKLLGPEGLKAGDIKHWLIHPGGPKILEGLGKQLKLDKSRMRASWHVLSEYGNCGATTVLLVLEEVLRSDNPQRGEYGVMMGFGPGLTVEGILVRF